MVPAMPAIRMCIAVSLALCFAVGPARAQFWGNNWGNGWRIGWGSPHHRVRPSPHAAHKPPAQTSESPEAAVQDTPLPYDHDLERLSDILGALHFLRGVCNSGEGEKWRSEAKALIDAQAPSETAASRWSRASIAAIAVLNKPITFARRRPTSSSAAIWKKAPRSPTISLRTTGTKSIDCLVNPFLHQTC